MTYTNEIALAQDLALQAASDEALRQRLLDDPNATITAETGVTIPDGVTLTATENPDGSITLAIAEGTIPDDLLAGLSAGCGGGGGGGGKGPHPAPAA